MYILYSGNNKEVQTILKSERVSELVHKCDFTMENYLFCCHNEYVYLFTIINDREEIVEDSNGNSSNYELLTDMLSRLNGGNKIDEFRELALIELGKKYQTAYNQQVMVAKELGITPRMLLYYLTDEIRQKGCYKEKRN